MSKKKTLLSLDSFKKKAEATGKKTIDGGLIDDEQGIQVGTIKTFTPVIEVVDIKTLSDDEQELIKETGGETVMQFIISTDQVDRDGDTIAVDGWDLKNFIKNPVVPWAHKYGDPPVAKATSTFVENGSLKSRSVFTPKDLYPFGDMVGKMYKQGFLNAVSVGFNPSKFHFVEDAERKYGVDFIEQELTEYSAVPVPANPGALIEARSAGIDTTPLIEWAEKILDDGETSLYLPSFHDHKQAMNQLRKAADEKSKVTVWMSEGSIIIEAEEKSSDDEETKEDLISKVKTYLAGEKEYCKKEYEAITNLLFSKFEVITPRSKFAEAKVLKTFAENYFFNDENCELTHKSDDELKKEKVNERIAFIKSEIEDLKNMDGVDLFSISTMFSVKEKDPKETGDDDFVLELVDEDPQKTLSSELESVVEVEGVENIDDLKLAISNGVKSSVDMLTGKIS